MEPERHRRETRCLALEARIAYERRQYQQLHKEMEELMAQNDNIEEQIGERHRLLESAHVFEAAERSQLEAKLAATTRDLSECQLRCARCDVRMNLRRVEWRAKEGLAAINAQTAALGARVRELESKHEKLLRRRENLLLVLSEPISTTEMEEALVEEAMKDVQIYEVRLHRVLRLPLNDIGPEEGKIIARLERSNLRRRMSQHRKKSSVRSNSMQFDHVTSNRRNLAFDELMLSDTDVQCIFDRLIVRLFRYESNCQETDRMTQDIDIYCARMQTELMRKRAKLRKLRAIEELREQVRVADRDAADRRTQLSVVLKKKNSMNADKRELNRSIAAAKSSKQTLEQLRLAVRVKEKTVAEREEIVVHRRKLVEELRRELEGGLAEFQMLQTRTQRLEAEAIATEIRIRAIHKEGRLYLQPP
jgi:hypothetical protein